MAKKTLPKNSRLVKIWVELIMDGDYKFNESPYFKDLHERVADDVVKIWVARILSEEYALENVPEDGGLRNLVKSEIEKLNS